MHSKESVRLTLPGELGLERLLEEWSVESHPLESRVLTFWDSFEWGLWFGGHLLYSCGEAYHLCTREEGWLGAELCVEQAGGRRRFWGEFESEAMRAKLEGLLGLRGLAPVAEGTFRLRRYDLRNETGKIVCRLERVSVSAGKRKVLLDSCRVIRLLGYEAEAVRVVEILTRAGASMSGDGPVELLLRHAKHVPREYSLRPVFGLAMDTPAREAVGRIVLTILEIAKANLPGILEDLDTEFLHDYRICLRKIRSLLSQLRDVYPAEGVRRMREILGNLARETNRLRDLDVYLLAREEYLGLLPPGLRPPLDRMFEDFSAERQREVKRVTSRIRSSSTRRLFREIEDYFSLDTVHESSPLALLPVGPLSFRRIYRRYRKIRVIAAAIGADTPDEVVHQLRIECKKLRYLMEFFAELIPGEEGTEMLKLLRRLQGRLGEFNDASVQQKSLLGYWEQKRKGNKIALGLGGLVSILYHRQQQSRVLIDQAIEQFCDPKSAAHFKHTFKRPASVPEADVQRTVPQ